MPSKTTLNGYCCFSLGTLLCMPMIAAVNNRSLEDFSFVRHLSQQFKPFFQLCELSCLPEFFFGFHL